MYNNNLSQEAVANIFYRQCGILWNMFVEINRLYQYCKETVGNSFTTNASLKFLCFLSIFDLPNATQLKLRWHNLRIERWIFLSSIYQNSTFTIFYSQPARGITRFLTSIKVHGFHGSIWKFPFLHEKYEWKTISNWPNHYLSKYVDFKRK